MIGLTKTMRHILNGAYHRGEIFPGGPYLRVAAILGDRGLLKLTNVRARGYGLTPAGRAALQASEQSK